ncbi:hypothetical protein AB870_12895 [Pandoraea faecigallinarum]|uniref:Uncharacterized protein n=1 Tax=Pandoraea faecigallinarum TaxID=656179 RepID=A0A0H3WWA7_9BURK|nr:hypothetical protein AB870_12895 [Pandoraea faecigallinarum]
MRNCQRTASLPAADACPRRRSTRRSGNETGARDKRALFLLTLLGVQTVLAFEAAATPGARICPRPAACTQVVAPWNRYDAATRATALRALPVQPNATHYPASRPPSIDNMAAAFAALSNTSVCREQARLRLMRGLIASGALDRGEGVCRLAQRLVSHVADGRLPVADSCSAAEHWARIALLQPPTLHDILSKFDLDKEGAAAPVNVTRLIEQEASPLHILRVVQYRRGRSLDAVVGPGYEWRGRLSVSSFEEAAAIHRLSAPHRYAQTDDADFDNIAACYERLLGDELAHLQLGARLIPPHAPDGGAYGIWFDGMAVRGAAGMSLDTVAAALHSRVHDIPALALPAVDNGMACPGRPLMPLGRRATASSAALSQLDVEMVLRAYFAELAESSAFRFGTPLQSAATTVLRLGAYHGLTPGPMDTPAQVLQAFVALRRAWLAAPRFPVDPLRVAASHLDRASGPAKMSPAPARPVRANNVPDEIAFARRLMAYVPWRPAASREAVDAPENAAPLQTEGRRSAFIGHGNLAIRIWRDGLRDTSRAFVSPDAAGDGSNAAALIKAEELMRLYRVPPNDTATHELAAALRDTWEQLSASNAAQSAPTPETLDVMQEMLEAILISRPIAHVVHAAARGDARAVLDMVPFVMPAYEIEEGLRTGNRTRVVNGAIRFGVDALFFWLAGVAERSLQTSIRLTVERLRMPPFERAASATLSQIGPEFEAFEMQALNAVQHDHVRLDPYDVLTDDAAVPEPYRDMPLPRRIDRTRSMEMFSDEQFELIQRSGIASPPAMQAADDLLTSSGMTAARSALLRRRETVVDMKRFLPDRRRGSLTNVLQGVGQALSCAMPADGSAAVSVRSILNPTCVESNAVVDALEDLRSRSHILQTLVERAMEAERGPWDIRIVDGEPPRFAPGMDALILPPAPQLTSRYQYESPAGKQCFTLEQAALHEFLHALTGLADASATGHRGPIVYLTDRIGHQAGRDWAERISYRAFGPNGELSPEAVLQRRTEATHWMYDEDALLDRYAREEFGVTANSFVDGERVTDRVTVKDVKRFASVLDLADYPQSASVEFVGSALDNRLGVTEELRSTFQRLMSSHLFRAFFSLRAVVEPRVEWQIRLTARSPSIGRRSGWAETPWRIDHDLSTIDLDVSPVFCLTASGPRPLSSEQRNVGLLIDLVTHGLKIRDVASPATQRGLKVYLENKLLQLPRGETRVAAALSHDPETLIPFITRARRGALDEDAYLASHV